MDLDMELDMELGLELELELEQLRAQFKALEMQKFERTTKNFGNNFCLGA